MTLPCLILFVSLGGLDNRQWIDKFDYADSAAAARAWVAAEGTPPVRAVREGGRQVLEFAAPFAADAKLSRAVLDRRVNLDLSVPGQFSLEIATDDPDAAGQITLYFRSGDGWYAAGTGLIKKGWQKLEFSKASFRVEGKPAGWQKIDGVRIAVWRGAAKDAAIRLADLAASWHEVALVIPAAQGHGEDGELRGARRTADMVGDMLRELGLGCDAVEDAALARGVLDKRRVAILAHNPRLGDEAAAALEQFVKLGGKLVVCYNLPPRLEKVLGFGRPKYVRPQTPDQFAEIRFEVNDIPGLPTSVRQDSWNITVAEPIGPSARVIGHWYDPQGKPTRHAAMLVSDTGAFFSHVILPDDREGKKRLLAAILGHFHPPLWQEMVRGELGRIAKVGHLFGSKPIAQYVMAAKNAEAEESLKTGLQMFVMAQQWSARQRYPEAVDRARTAHELLVEAYLRATPSRTPEGRAFWNHSGTGAYPGDWERTAKELAAGGLNMIVPNMLWGGLAHYESDVLPRSATVKEHGDQIARCVTAARKHGLEVHVWKVNYNLSTAPRDFVKKLREAGRTQVSAGGEPIDWLCPSQPENLKLELESMLEVARKYDVDGLHFDYIRYPDGEHCYCDGCRQRFEAQSGKPVTRWPADCHRGPRRDEYRDWRCRQITQLVEAVHREARKLKPKIKISAAVFGAYPSCRESVGQDWVQWVKAGYLDFLCPMDYSESDLSFETLVTNQLKLVGGRIPVYPGIGATASASALPVDRVVGQIHHARSLGAAGFTIFNLDRSTIQSLVPGIRMGATARPAVPPHKK